MKALNRFWIWLGMPAVLFAAAYLQSVDLARVAAVLMWVTAIAVGTTVTLAFFVILPLKPSDKNWAETKQKWADARPGALSRAVSWVSLLITVALAAYAGFAVTAAVYFLTSLWTRLAVTLIETHFTRAEQQA